jgi:four helix bundle protein
MIVWVAMKTKYQRYLNNNKNINRGYRKLIVWNEAIDLFDFVKRKLDTLKGISFKTKAQIEDSALSISSNIAEGYCRRYLKENIQFINIALASLGENYSQIFALLNSDIIERKWFEEYDIKHYSLENKLIKLNRTYLEKSKNNESWKKDYYIKDIYEVYKSDND